MKLPFWSKALFLCSVMLVPSAFADEQDMFYDANITLMRASRLEKEQNYKEAVVNCRKAAKMLKDLQAAHPDWNPSWVDGKMKEAQEILNRAKPLIAKTKENKPEDLSLKPGEWRHFTLERAYEAHKSGKVAAKPYSPPERPRYVAPRPAEHATPAPAPAPEVVVEASRPAPQPNRKQVTAPRPAPQQVAATPKPQPAPKREAAKQKPTPAPVIRAKPTTTERPYTRPTQRRSGQRSRFRIG